MCHTAHVWLVIGRKEGERDVFTSAYMNRQAAKEKRRLMDERGEYDETILTKRQLRNRA